MPVWHGDGYAPPPSTPLPLALFFWGSCQGKGGRREALRCPLASPTQVPCSVLLQSQRGFQTRPYPTQTLSPPPFSCFPDFLRDVWKSGAGGWSGRRGHNPNPTQLERRPAVTVRPPAEGGGAAPSQELGMVGAVDSSTPQAPAPTLSILISECHRWGRGRYRGA